MNHSFNPSCYIKDDNIVALHDIEPGTELTFNYNENEVDMACPFIHNSIPVTGKKLDNQLV